MATVTLAIDSVNDAPQGADTTVMTLEDTAYTFPLSNFGFSGWGYKPDGYNVLVAGGKFR